MLTSGAPVGRAVVVALAARLDPCAAAGAGLAGAAVDVAVAVAVEATASRRHRRREHPRPCVLDDRDRLLVADVADAAPRVDLGAPAALGLPDVADAGDVALVEQRVADPRVWSSARSLRRNRCGSQSSASRSRPERAQARVEAGARLGHQLQQRPVELDHLLALGAQHEPGAAGRAAPARADRMDRPGAGHAQVGVERQVALEAQEEVLAVRVDAEHAPPCQPLGPAVGGVARVRRADLVRHLALQHRADPSRGAQNRVPFGHPTKGTRRRAARVNDLRTPAPRRVSSAPLVLVAARGRSDDVTVAVDDRDARSPRRAGASEEADRRHRSAVGVLGVVAVLDLVHLVAVASV